MVLPKIDQAVEGRNQNDAAHFSVTCDIYRYTGSDTPAHENNMVYWNLLYFSNIVQ